MTEARAPAKKWRVRPYGGENVSYTSERKAYDAIPAITAAGKTAVVEHWENDYWRRYERISPNGSAW